MLQPYMNYFVPFNFASTEFIVSSNVFFFSSHSQITITFQPASSRAFKFCRSRSTFRWIFGIQ